MMYKPMETLTKKTWILVANRSGASLFERLSKGEVTLTQEIAHPKGRLKNSEIDADEPVLTFDRFGQGRHAAGESDSTEHVAQQFAQNLANILNQGRINHAYDELVLIAAPEFLGILLKTLDNNTLTTITKTIDKNLPNIKQRELAAYLDE